MAPPMSARAAILAALAPDAAPDAAARAREAAALLVATERPPVADVATDALFVAQLIQPQLAATHDAVASLRDVPAAVARYLAEKGAAPQLYLPPDPRLEACDWTGIDRLAAVPVDGGAALAFALAGVAETGSLVLDTGAHAPMLPNFLALYHVIVVERRTIVHRLEDVPAPPPPGSRTRCWITGVSGTTDIEGHYVRGAHGPRFLHVVIVG
jgi:L-lactate dehydrogenase complex protein LldG